MDDEEILAQLFMVGYPGKAPSTELVTWIQKRGIGGVKIFGWNAEDTEILSATIASLQGSALGSEKGIPLLVATDQEGGWIRHVKGRTSESPGNMALGAVGSSLDAYWAGYFIGKELALLGIRMNFAPVVDLATDPSSEIIGPRAFSDDPALVGRLGLAFARGTLAAGVIPTAKHFPGHGATPLDSHGILPEISIDLDTLRNRELSPFAYLSDHRVPAVMSGHLSFPKISGFGSPASLSRDIIHGELRGFLGFEGLVITDDLYMSGASGELSITETCEKAIRAGNDMLLLSVTPEVDGALWRHLLNLYREDREFATQVREAATRVLEAKIAYLKPLGPKALIPSPESARARLPNLEAKVFFADLARRSATLIQGKGALPFKPEGKVLLAGAYDRFLALGLKAYPGAQTMKIRSPGQLEEFIRRMGQVDAVVLCISSESHRAFAYAARDKGLPLAVVSVLSPYRARDLEFATAIVAVYHFAEICLAAGFEVLEGKLSPRGILPIDMEGR